MKDALLTAQVVLEDVNPENSYCFHMWRGIAKNK